MSAWPSSKGAAVRKALEKIGWKEIRQRGSHRTLARLGYENFVFAFGDSEEIGPVMLARIAKKTGMTPEDL